MSEALPEPPSEAQIARATLDLAQRFHDGEEAIVKLAEIEEIIDGVMQRIPNADANVPWDALIAIRKVMR